MAAVCSGFTAPEHGRPIPKLQTRSISHRIEVAGASGEDATP
jgi:hypothetical protein